MPYGMRLWLKKMPDPLGQILDLSHVKKEDLFMVVRFYCIQP